MTARKHATPKRADPTIEPPTQAPRPAKAKVKPRLIRFPPEVDAALEHQAQRSGESVNSLVVRAAERAVGRPVSARSACRHPIGRRIGGHCALCGARVA